MTETLEDAVRGAAEAAPTTGTTLAQDMMSAKFLERIGRVLPQTSRLTPEQLAQAMLNEIAKSAADPRGSLIDCTRSSIAGTTLACAELGLSPGPLGLVYITPRNRNVGNRQTPQWIRECQLQIGYKGYLKLCRNSGEVRDVDAWTVYEGDDFEFWRDETGSKLRHRPAPESQRGEGVRWYMHAILLNGAPVIEVLERSDVDRRMKMSQGYDSEYSPWKTNYEAMAKKSCFRSKLAWLPIDTETAQRLSYDEMVVEDRAGHLVATYPEPPEVDPAAEQLAELKTTIGDYLAALSLEDRADAIVEMTAQFGPSHDLDVEKAEKAARFIAAYRTNGPPPAQQVRDDGTPITTDRVKEIQILFGKLGVKERDVRIAQINDLIAPAPPVDSSKNLTETQGVAVVTALATRVSQLEDDEDPVGMGEPETAPETDAPGDSGDLNLAAHAMEEDAYRDEADARFETLFQQFEGLITDELTEPVLRAAVREVYDPGFTTSLLNLALKERGMPTQGVSVEIRRRRLAITLASERVTDPGIQILKPFEDLGGGAR